MRKADLDFDHTYSKVLNSAENKQNIYLYDSFRSYNLHKLTNYAIDISKIVNCTQH